MYIYVYTYTHTHTHIGMRSFDDDDQRDIAQDEDGVDMYGDTDTLNERGSMVLRGKNNAYSERGNDDVEYPFLNGMLRCYMYVCMYVCIFIYTCSNSSYSNRVWKTHFWMTC